MKSRLFITLFSTILVLAYCSSIAQASFGKIVVNGKEVPPFYFELAAMHENSQLEEEDSALFDPLGKNVLECKKEIDDFVLEEIVLLFLIMDAARVSEPDEVERISKYSVFSENYEGDLQAPSEGTPQYEESKLRELTFHGGLLEDGLLGHVDSTEVEERYQEMIENEHPFLVNVPVFKLNTLIFRTFEEAVIAKQRLEAGESYISLTEEYKQTKYYAVRGADKWQRYGSLFDIQNYIDKPVPSLKKGEITDPVVMLGGLGSNSFGYLGWNIFQVVETSVVPLVGYKDDYSTLHMSTRSILRELMIIERKSTFRQDLWAAATVSVDGVPRPEYSGRVEFLGCSQ